MKKIKYLILCLFFVFCSCNRQSDFDKALEYQDYGEYEEAIEYYVFSINKGEKVALAEKKLGDIFFSRQNYREAFNHYKKSLEVDAEVALDKVMQFISHSDLKVKNYAYLTLNDLKNKESKLRMFDYLSTVLKSKNQYKILDVLELLPKLKNYIPVSEALLDLLNIDNSMIKREVLPLLPNIAGMVVKRGYLDKIIALLNQDNEVLKNLAIDCLGDMFGWAQKAYPDLVVVAVDPMYRKRVLRATEKIGVPTKEQVNEIFNYLKDKPEDLKIAIIEQIGNKRTEAKPFVPNFIAFLNDNSDDVKLAVRRSLSRIGKANKSCVPELIAMLQDDNEEIVSRVIYELGDLGKDAGEAVDALKKIAENENTKKELKDLAKTALQKIQE